MAVDAAGQEKARIFISYSRNDSAFVEQLEAKLKERGFEPLIDRTDIYAFEDWWQRIQALIAQADTVVFVLSPDSISSSVCRREVAFAASLNKRLAPIVCRHVDPEAVPPELSRLNFIFLDDEANVRTGLETLVEALSTNIEWIRGHTQYGDQARRWSDAGRPGPRGLLLRSPVLEEAERWIAARPAGAPQPTETTQAFISESRLWATRRRNILTAGLIAGLVVASALAGLAYQERGIAVAQRDLSETRRVAALAAVANSEVLRGNIDAALRLAVHASRLALKSDQGANGDSVARTALLGAINQSRWQITLNGASSPIFNPDGSHVLTNSYDKATGWKTQTWDVRTGHKTAEWPGLFTSACFNKDGTRIATIVTKSATQILDAATGARIADLDGHTDSVNSISFSPDGQRVVTASQDKTARVWDAISGKLILTLQGHDGPVNSAAFSRDGSRIVTASSDKTARVWDAKTGEPLVILRGHEGVVVKASFSSDGSRIVTASYDQTARIWDTSTGAQVHVLRGHTFVLYSAEFNADGSRVLTTSWDHSARLWDAEKGTQIMSTLSSGLSQYELESAAFSPDGSKVAVGSGTVLRILDAGTGKELSALNGHEHPIKFVAFSPDELRVITESFDEPLRIWNLSEASKIMELRGSESDFNSVEISPHGTHILATSQDGTFRVWSTKTGKELLKWSAFQADNAHYSPDGSEFLVVYGGIAEVFDADTLKSILKTNLLAGDEHIKNAQFSPDGRQIVTISSSFSGLIAGSNNNAEIWDLKSGKELAVLRGHTAPLSTAYFSADGSRVVTASHDKTARVWDAGTGAQIAIMTGHTEWVYAAFFSPDGTRVFTESGDKTTRVWDATNGAQLSLLNGTIYDVLYPSSSHPELSPDGARIVTVAGNVATIWDTASGKELVELHGHTREVEFAAFSQDGSRVVTASGDHTARIWDAETGKQLAVLRGHDQNVSRAVFSPDGSQILTKSNDNSLRLWDVRFATTSTEDLINQVCTILLGRRTELNLNEMSLAGYGSAHPIDVCATQQSSDVK